MKPENRATGPVRIAILLGLAAALVASTERTAVAQYATSIPFNPWQAQYEAFVYPVVSSNLALPNQARNQFGYGPAVRDDYGNFDPFGDYRNWANSLTPNLSTVSPENRDRVGSANGGRYLPYYSFNRLYDADYNRYYTPNAAVDQRYYEDRQRREDLYLQTLSEQDPQKRAELLRQLEQANRATRRDLGITRRRNPGEVGAGFSAAPPAPELGPNARRGSAFPGRSSATARGTMDRPAPAGEFAPGNAVEAPAASQPGLPPSSLRRPLGGVGIGRQAYPRSAAPRSGSLGSGLSGLGTERDPGLDAPSRRRTPAASPPRR